MEFLEQKELHGNIIKAQYKINEDIYAVTFSDGKWKLFLNGNKKITESKDFEKIYERIPEGSK